MLKSQEVRKLAPEMDPLRMGMAGAAIATVLGQILTAGLSVWYLCHMKAVKLYLLIQNMRHGTWIRSP